MAATKKIVHHQSDCRQKPRADRIFVHHDEVIFQPLLWENGQFCRAMGDYDCYYGLSWSSFSPPPQNTPQLQIPHCFKFLRWKMKETVIIGGQLIRGEVERSPPRILLVVIIAALRELFHSYNFNLHPTNIITSVAEEISSDSNDRRRHLLSSHYSEVLILANIHPMVGETLHWIQKKKHITRLLLLYPMDTKLDFAYFSFLLCVTLPCEFAAGWIEKYLLRGWQIQMTSAGTEEEKYFGLSQSFSSPKW